MAATENFAAVIVAAGLSKRMGTFKPLLPYRGGTLLNAAVSCFSRAGIENVYAVLGHRADEAMSALNGTGAKTVINAGVTAGGMLESVKLGIAALNPDIEAFFLMPGDMPALRHITAIEMMRSFSGEPVIYPSFEGQRGHPPLISRECFGHILAYEGENGLLGALSAYEASSKIIEFPDRGIVLDADTPEDYFRLTQYAETADIPDENTCLWLLKMQNAPEKLVAHCAKVKDVAVGLANRLIAAGRPINPDIVRAAALLHDIKKGTPDHAASGAEYLSELGFERICAPVSFHHDIGEQSQKALDESAVLFLADKLVMGDNRVGLDERFDDALRKYSDEDARIVAEKRRKQAKYIMDSINKLCEGKI